MEATVLEQSAVKARRQSPAEVVIAVFGGVRALARLYDCDPSTLCRWKERGGRVPARHHEPLLELAKLHRKRLTTNDLVHGRERSGR